MPGLSGHTERGMSVHTTPMQTTQKTGEQESMARPKQSIQQVADLIDGPLKGERRGVNANQQYVAFTEDTGNGQWVWAVYKFNKEVDQGVAEYSWAGTAHGSHPNFSYRDGEIHWDGKEEEAKDKG